MLVRISLLTFFTLFILPACTVYESDARKFIREQGLEFARDNRVSVTTYAQQHCQASAGAPPASFGYMISPLYHEAYFFDEIPYNKNLWHSQQQKNSLRLDFYHYNIERNETYKCAFVKTKAEDFPHFDNGDLDLITNICNYYVAASRP